MGLMHFNGVNDLQKDEVEAEQLIRLAAEKGLTRAAHDLGLMYQQGSGVEKDRAESRKWFKACAAAGDERCVAELKASR